MGNDTTKSPAADSDTVCVFETEVPVRYRDLDPMGHVNNAVYATYVETARERFFTEAVGEQLATTEAALASLSLTFLSPVYADETVHVETVVAAIGETSCTFAHRLTVGDRQVATAEGTMVTLADGEPTPLSESIRAGLERYAVEQPPWTDSDATTDDEGASATDDEGASATDDEGASATDDEGANATDDDRSEPVTTEAEPE